MESQIFKNGIIYNGDCLEIMDALIEKGIKVNLIITSPPYNMNLRVMNGKFISRWNSKGNENHFSTKYSEYKDDLTMEDYYEFQKKFIEKSLNICDLMFYNIQMVTGNKIALLKLLGYFAENIKEIIIWDKINGQPAMNNGCLNSKYEFIIIFSKNNSIKRSFDNPIFKRGTLDNLWSIKRERNKYIKAGFPQKLIEKILENFSRENDVVLEPFMGSGTTCLVCQNMNRKFIGIELYDKYYKIAKERLEQNV